MILHADAIAQNRSSRVRAGGIDGNDSDRSIFFAIVFCQLIDQRALACAGRAGHTENPSCASLGKESFQQISPSRPAIFHRADGARQRSRIPVAQPLDQSLVVVAQAFSVMQEDEIRNRSSLARGFRSRQD